MAIRVEHRPNQNLRSLLEFYTGFVKAEKENEMMEAQMQAQQAKAWGDHIGGGIQSGINFGRDRQLLNAQHGNRMAQIAAQNAGRMDLQNLIGSQYDARAQADRDAQFADIWGESAMDVVRGVPDPGMPGGPTGPPSSLQGPMPDPEVPGALGEFAAMQRGEPMGPPMLPAGPPHYAQNPASVPHLRQAELRLAKVQAAKTAIETNAHMPADEKTAAINMLTPHAEALSREIAAIRKSHPAPPPPTFQSLVADGTVVPVDGTHNLLIRQGDGVYKQGTATHPVEQQENKHAPWKNDLNMDDPRMQDPAFAAQAEKEAQKRWIDKHTFEIGGDLMAVDEKSKIYTFRENNLSELFDTAQQSYLDRLTDSDTEYTITPDDQQKAIEHAKEVVKAKREALGLGPGRRDTGGGDQGVDNRPLEQISTPELQYRIDQLDLATRYGRRLTDEEKATLKRIREIIVNREGSHGALPRSPARGPMMDVGNQGYNPER